LAHFFQNPIPFLQAQRLKRFAIPTVGIQISTPMIATLIKVVVVVFVDLLKKLTSLFFR